MNATTYLSSKMNTVINKVEGMAHTVVLEMQNIKHFIQEEETMIEDKISEWREHASKLPGELQERITSLKNLI
jgi:hypothetical protein